MRIAAALLSALLLFACAHAEADFAPLHFSLRGDPSLGFEWTCEYQDNGVLSPPMEDYIADAQGGGLFEYHFGVNAAGEAQIIFNYAPTLSIDRPSQTIICTVDVHENGENSVFWAQVYADDGTLMFILPANPTTGMNWNFGGDSEGVISLTSENYVADFADLEGAGGLTTYLFRVEGSGRALLTFNLCDMWNPYAAAEQTYAAEVIVDENMEISLSVDNSWGGG